MRKILHNYSKSKRLHGIDKGKIGSLLGIRDKNGEYLTVGDKVKYGKYVGIILYNYYFNQYGIVPDYSMWYGDNKYDINSYGKFVKIPLDNGARMELEKVK